MKTLRGRQYSFKHLPQFKMLNKVLDPLACNINDFLTRATVFLHSLERGYLAQSWCSSPMKMLIGRQYSFKQLTQFTMLKEVLNPLLQTFIILLQELQCTFYSLVWSYFAQNWCSSPMKTLRRRQYSFKQLTQFTMMNKVLYPLASNINDSPTRATVLLPFTWMRWFCT
jgi:hypothetical protein